MASNTPVMINEFDGGPNAFPLTAKFMLTVTNVENFTVMVSVFVSGVTNVNVS